MRWGEIFLSFFSSYRKQSFKFRMTLVLTLPWKKNPRKSIIFFSSIELLFFLSFKQGRKRTRNSSSSSSSNEAKSMNIDFFFFLWSDVLSKVHFEKESIDHVKISGSNQNVPRLSFFYILLAEKKTRDIDIHT